MERKRRNHLPEMTVVVPSGGNVGLEQLKALRCRKNLIAGNCFGLVPGAGLEPARRLPSEGF